MIARIRLDRRAGNGMLQCRAQICELGADKGFSPNQTEVCAEKTMHLKGKSES